MRAFLREILAVLGEPGRTPYDLNFVLFGFPVRIHPFFWLITLFLVLSAQRSTPADVLVWVLALTFSILVHELGHATVMRTYGFHPWITLHGFGGLASYAPGEPVGPRARTPLAHVIISLAGPGAGFLLAAVIIAGVKLSGHFAMVRFGGDYGIQIGVDIGSPIFSDFLFNVLVISILWGLVNLLPVYPLDGGQIARELLLVVNPRNGIRQSLMLSIFTATCMAIVGLAQWRSLFVGFLFGYLAFMSYQALQAYNGRGRGW